MIIFNHYPILFTQTILIPVAFNELEINLLLSSQNLTLFPLLIRYSLADKFELFQNNDSFYMYISNKLKSTNLLYEF